MEQIRNWLSVKIQRALGFESKDDVVDIVANIMDKKKPEEIENLMIVQRQLIN